MKYLLFLLFTTFLCSQPVHTIMSYNLLNYPGNDTTTRNPYYRTIFQSIKPDILAIQEIQSQAGVDGFLNNVLNADTALYAAGDFINGPDTDRAIFYKTELFTFISNTPIPTTLRDINEFKMLYNYGQDTLRIYTVHLKASQGSDNELRRLEEVTELRNFTANLDTNSYFIVLGDFNIYRSTEPAFQKLLDQTTPGHFLDPLNLTGVFNQAQYAAYHTQSTRTRSFGGGATGGLDDRFDMILISQSVSDPGGITYVLNSTVPYGNDGQHYNDSINSPPNNAVGQIVADALHYASDHLPIIASCTFENSSVQIIVNLSIGWNLISAPVSAPDMSGSSLFPGATTSFFSYNEGYQIDSILMNGKGYWAMFDSTHNVMLNGFVIDSSDITVKNGWNLIGPFSTDIPVATITSTPNNIIESAFFGYYFGYAQASTLLKGRGYWIRTNQNGILHLYQ